MRKGYLSARNHNKYKIYHKLINSYRWQQLRRRKFIANPVCEDCLKEGRVTPTEEVHHIIPVENGKDEAEMKRLAYDYDNLRSLCRACHGAYHARPEPNVSKEVTSFFDSLFNKK